MSARAESEDISFVHYSFKHRIIAWVSANLFDHVTYTVRHGLLTGMKRKGGLGWLPQSLSPGLSTPELEFWKALDLDGKTVYDVGSFHGLLALYFASHAERVVCFEPNSRNYKRLMENVRLNSLGNVQARKVGIGSRAGKIRMVANPLTPGGASVDEKAVGRLEKSGAKTVTEEIEIVTLDSELVGGQIPAPDFIKIDIEGWELEALRGAREVLRSKGPELFLEMHGDTMREKKRKVAEIVEFLWDIDYRNIRHVESGSEIAPDNTGVAAQGHLYCRRT